MEIEDVRGPQETQDSTKTSSSSSVHVGDASQAISQKEREVSSAKLSSRTIRLDVQFPKFLPGGYGSRDELARENFVNFYNGVKYLLTKYGDVPFSKKFIVRLTSKTPSLRDTNGRLILSDQVPRGYRKKPFTANDLHALENLIINKNSSRASKGRDSLNMVDAQGKLRSDVPRPVLVASEDVLRCINARENYRNYHTGMNYLVKKYGSRLVNETLTELKTSWVPGTYYPRLIVFRDENGQEQLKSIPDDDASILLFNFDNNMLQELENLIIEHGKWQGNPILQNIGRGLEVVGAANQTARAAISLFEAVATGNPDILDITAKVLSFASSVSDDCKLGLEIQDDPASKGNRRVLKNAKAMLKTARTTISLGQAVATGNSDTLGITTKALFLGSNISNDALLGLEALGKVAADKTISPPAILREEEKLVYYADEENIAREHFEDFYNAAKYLIKKYGITSMPVDFLNELKALCGGEIPLVPDDQGQLQLANSVPNGHRGKPFTMKNLAQLENRITGQEGRERLKVALKIGEVIAATAGAIATCGAGLTIPGAMSLAKAAYDGVQLAIELFQD
ncbi:MAG: hypothetical protein LBE98_03860 [Puniceicoccales bacterium]|jgi:hypothetical protein|nr:hypothetical protein [Puniceicoccales bacterium]